jgi:hypothetical protein
MIRLKLCFVAEAVIRDADTNAVSAFNILEALTPAGFPILVQRISCYTLWERENNDAPQVNGRFTVAIGDNVLNETAIRMDFAGAPKAKTLINMNGLILPQPGLLRFQIDLDGGAHAEYTVDVNPPPAAVVQVANHPQ